jgi:two-component system, OmpR family, sensor histidine kinase KdpD
VKPNLFAHDKADSFLRMIRHARRGRLKIYLGYGAGVGKTYQMLLEGHRLKAEGIDAVVGLVETHGRAETSQLTEGLELIPRRREEYRGVILEEMDVDAVLARKPEVALIDELAHTNAPGSRNPKRYQDVQDILAAGIHVITTLNIQHLESLYDTVEKTVRVKVRERLPDTVVSEADEIVNVDLTPEDLRKRLEEGKIYPPDRIGTALTHFFTDSNLETLRELTLRELAAQIDQRRREQRDEEAATPDQVMVCLSSRGPNSETLLRYASRVAGRLNRNWYAVYVQTPSEAPSVIDAHTQNILSSALTLAKQLGAMVFTYKGEDIADTILRFAKEYRVGHIVIGSPGPMPLWKRLLGKKSIVESLVDRARGVTIVVLDTRKDERPADAEEPSEHPIRSKQKQAAHEPLYHQQLSSWLSRDSILLWDDPVPKEVALRALVESANNGTIGDPNMVLIGLLKREQESSTFFNEGVAFPHARLANLPTPIVTLGIAKQGVSDVSTDEPVRLVFLILSPSEEPETQVRLLGLLSRAAQSRHLLQELLASTNAAEAFHAVRGWDLMDHHAVNDPK